MFIYSKRTYGHGVEPAEIIGHHRALLAGVSALGLASEVLAKTVDRRIKHLAMLRTAQLIGCQWCLDFGSRIAHDSGVPEADLRELATWRGSERFGERDRLALEYAEAMTRTPLTVTDERFDRLRRHFDERQLVELTMSIAIENLYSRANWALGIEGQGFSEGMYCVRPDVAGARSPRPRPPRNPRAHPPRAQAPALARLRAPVRQPDRAPDRVRRQAQLDLRRARDHRSPDRAPAPHAGRQRPVRRHVLADLSARSPRRVRSQPARGRPGARRHRERRPVSVAERHRHTRCGTTTPGRATASSVGAGSATGSMAYCSARSPLGSARSGSTSNSEAVRL